MFSGDRGVRAVGGAWPVQEDDLLNLGVGAGLEECMASGESSLPRVLAPRGGGALLRQSLLRFLENGQEDALLVVEVVIEGALRHAGATHQVLDGGGRIAFGAEALSLHWQA